MREESDKERESHSLTWISDTKKIYSSYQGLYWRRNVWFWLSWTTILHKNKSKVEKKRVLDWSQFFFLIFKVFLHWEAFMLFNVSRMLFMWFNVTIWQKKRSLTPKSNSWFFNHLGYSRWYCFLRKKYLKKN